MARVESPERIQKFLTAMNSIEWTDKSAAIKNIHNEVNLLADAEIRYYYTKRVYKRRLTGWLKILMLLFFSISILLPLLKNTGQFIESIDTWGYVFFAIAGICFTIDKTFTGSSGHMRYVVTQIKLEKLLTSFNLKWQNIYFEMGTHNENESCRLLFASMIEFTDEFYKILNDETQEWKAELTKVLEDLSKKAKS
ncbi:MAG: SLATT domain-containing protein [Flavobacterium sp.]|nr:SLATT domain-containing protein [Flavobacterium sp.]